MKDHEVHINTVLRSDELPYSFIEPSLIPDTHRPCLAAVFISYESFQNPADTSYATNRRRSRSVCRLIRLHGGRE